jgi:putative transposase
MAHSYTNLLIHVVFSTAERRPLIAAELKPELFAYMGGIIKSVRGKPLLINGPRDHVHALLVAPPTLSVSDLMEKLKANSSKWVHKHWAERKSFAWQAGYAAFSVSQSRLNDVRSYIANQEEHHRKLTYQEEILALLKKHGIECDARFVFD